MQLNNRLLIMLGAPNKSIQSSILYLTGEFQLSLMSYWSTYERWACIFHQLWLRQTMIGKVYHSTFKLEESHRIFHGRYLKQDFGFWISVLLCENCIIAQVNPANRRKHIPPPVEDQVPFILSAFLFPFWPFEIPFGACPVQECPFPFVEWLANEIRCRGVSIHWIASRVRNPTRIGRGSKLGEGWIKWCIVCWHKSYRLKSMVTGWVFALTEYDRELLMHKRNSSNDIFSTSSY